MIVSRYTTLLFDADQTLFDFVDASALAFADYCHHFNIADVDTAYKIYSKHNKEAWHDLEVGKITTTEVRYRRFARFLDELQLQADPIESNTFYLDKVVGHTKVYEDTIEVLTALSETHTLGVITNGLKEVQRRRLEHTEITGFFDIIVVSDEIGVAKPKLAYFDLAFGLLKDPIKSKILVIGDSLNSDIVGANNAGVDSAWIRRDGNHNLADKSATYQITSLRDLL